MFYVCSKDKRGQALARDFKIEVSAVNLRIPEDHDRDYISLIETLHSTRRGVKVYGQSYVAISHFEPSSCLGIFSKYTEIDVDGDWFDIDDFDVASDEDIGKIVIPENLRPNLDLFYFFLDPEMHFLVFERYGQSKGLSTNSVEKYFSEALVRPPIVERFGRVESDVIKSYGEVERLVNLPDLRELRLIIRRPNSDDVGGELAKIIEERLKEQNGDEYEETLRTKENNGLHPNERTKDLAQVAAENGQVKARSLVNGVLVTQDTKESPLVEVRTYKADTSEQAAFLSVVRVILSGIAEVRARLNG